MNHATYRLKAIHRNYASLPDGESERLFANNAKAIRAQLSAPSAYHVSGGEIAVYDFVGEVTPQRALHLREQLNFGRDNDAVTEGLLLINSYGGSVQGTDDLAEAVYRFAQRKRLTTFFEEAGCSAAYWFGSQATELIVNPTGILGSIGCFVALLDLSRAFEREGMEVVVVKSGAAKGSRIDGLKIDQATLDRVQREVDQIARVFIGRVARGRRMDVRKISDVADGETWMGDAAKTIGLVDRVMVLEDLVAEIVSRSARRLSSEPSALASVPARSFDDLATEYGTEFARKIDIIRGNAALLAKTSRQSGAKHYTSSRVGGHSIHKWR